MTRALRFAVYIIAGLCALSALGYFYYDGYVRFPTLEDRAGFVKKLAENEQSWARYKLERMDSKDPRYYLCRPISPQKPSPTKFMHPLLGVKYGEMLTPKVLANVNYKRMRELACGEDVGDFEYANFHEAELAAAEGFCKFIKGRSESGIREWLGAPDYFCNDVPLWEPLKPGQERWVYDLGLEPISVKLILQDGVCVESSICGSAEIDDLASCREYQICKSAIGKSIDVIVAKNGPPNQIFDLSCKPIKRHQNEERMYYFLRAGDPVSLETKHGICVEVYGIAFRTKPVRLVHP
ncbi:MAG: hypothetical protein IPP97_27070 [Candidatus Obscuribacter sp.]|nr:hypothetical protein [Candidatus Obscuribacter sp.]